MKPGLHTTEFWTSMLVSALCAYLVVTGKVPAQWGLAAMGLSQGTYNWSRGYAKRK